MSKQLDSGIFNRIQKNSIILAATSTPTMEKPVALNGEEIVAVEVKTTLSKDKLKDFLFHLKKFKEYFPEHGDKVVYGGVAYMDDDRGAGSEAIAQGLFAISAPGGDASVAKIVNPEGFKPKVF